MPKISYTTKVKIDGKTITIKDGVIKAQDAGAKITWRKWTE
mgnify:CR=1 FL=1